ncbi:hypothetical protein AOLI_G00141410 [Acnodon oligacanthus]
MSRCRRSRAVLIARRRGGISPCPLLPDTPRRREAAVPDAHLPGKPASGGAEPRVGRSAVSPPPSPQQYIKRPPAKDPGNSQAT